MVLATGHLNPFEIFELIDTAKSCGVKRILINHPLTGVVGATMDEQKEMAKYAFLEQCFVACMPLHDNLNPDVIVETIDYVGSKKCIMATDFGQKHNLTPINGFKLFIKSLMDRGISEKHINTMCSSNPRDLIY
jgi:microsomal dipeptidase-like Zn-dependent dipeptidase